MCYNCIKETQSYLICLEHHIKGLPCTILLGTSKAHLMILANCSIRGLLFLWDIADKGCILNFMNRVTDLELSYQWKKEYFSVLKILTGLYGESMVSFVGHLDQKITMVGLDCKAKETAKMFMRLTVIP